MECDFWNMLLSFRRRVHPFLFILIFSILFVGCPLLSSQDEDEGGGSDDPPLFTDEPLYEETNSIITEAIDTVKENLTSLDLASAMLAAADALTVHDCVRSVSCDVEESESGGEGDPYLLVRFTNGILYQMHVVHSEAVDKDNLLPEKNEESIETFTRSNLSRSISFCDNTFVLLLNDPEFKTDVLQWKSFFDKQPGYYCQYDNTVSVEDFQSLDAYGFVYISSHGDTFSYNNESYFQFDLPHPRNTADDLQYIKNGDFQDISVILETRIYVVENEDPYVRENINYAVTQKYIKKYSGSFPDDFIFFADACFSASPIRPKGSTGDYTVPLVKTLQKKGSGNILGWDHMVHFEDSIRAGNFLIGQMMGDFTGLSQIGFTGLPFRPYSLPDAFTALQHKTWQYDRYGTELVLYVDDEAILRPSVQQLIVDIDLDRQTEELIILGNFGEISGSILLCENANNPDGGSAMSWTDWQDDRVRVNLGGDDCGYVAARVNGINGNLHPLSRWEITGMEVTGTQTGNAGPDVKLTIDASWRAEIVDERGLITEGETVPATGWADPLPELSRSSSLLDLASTCDYEFTGTFEDDDYIYEYPDGMNKDSKTVFLKEEEMFFGVVALQPDLNTATIQINFRLNAQVLKTEKKTGETQMDEIPVIVPLYFTAEMEMTGKITGGEEIIPYAYSWPDIEPEFPPTTETAR